MDKITITINDVQITTKKGSKILWAALDAGIYIPHLCAMKEKNSLPFGSCRLCLVEVDPVRELMNKLVASCSEPARDGMRVYTDTPRVKRMVKTAFELLLADHSPDCKGCSRKGQCELNNIAARLSFKLKSGRFRKRVESRPIDTSHPYFIIDPNRCVLCGKCVWVCNELMGEGILDFANRGLETILVRVENSKDKEEIICKSCLKCLEVCPTAGLVAY